MIKDTCITYKLDIRVDIVREAIKDYLYLLNRGFPQEQSLSLVVTRYNLSKKERMLLLRSIHGQRISEHIISKTIACDKLACRTLIVDGLNVLLTIIAALRCDLLILGDDGFIRDLQGVHGKVKYDIYFFKALERLGYGLHTLGLDKVYLFFDKNVKMIGFYSNIIRKVLTKYIDNVKIILSPSCDKEIMSYNGVVSTSDIVILRSVDNVFDLAGYIVTKLMLYPNVFDIKNNI